MSLQEHRFFWRQHPAFLLSLTLLIGTGAALFWSNPWNWLFPLLWCFYLIFLKKWELLLLLPAMAVYSHLLYSSQPQPGLIQGIFSTKVLQPHQSPFAKGFVYKGTLYTLDGSIPCDIYTQGTSPPQMADRDYVVSGKLDQRGPYQYSFKPKQWLAVEKSWSLAHLRYLAKERYRNLLSDKCSSYPHAAAFLVALTTGDVDDRLLKYEFGKVGLQHLLAISGFHFGILTAFALTVLSIFFVRFWKLFVLAIGLTAYYLFVGPFPAVQRSWLTAIVYLIGKMFGRQTSGLNLLGFSLGVEIVLNPLVASNLGFQFSFASTAGILLFHPLLERILRPLLPHRPAQGAISLPFFAKHVYLLSSFLRHSLALTFAVSGTILPILLFHFSMFPPLSLLYNLFYPFCVAIALSILLIALILQCLIPSLASLFFYIDSWFTHQLLEFAAYPPTALDTPLFSHFPAAAIPFYLFSLLILSIRLSSNVKLLGGCGTH